MSDAGAPIELDPFGFLTGIASRVPGLGGASPGHDPTYVFHTPYVTVASGPATFGVAFDNLRAKQGTLTLRVHMLPDEPGGVARLVNSVRIQLNRLVSQGGAIAVGFDGYRGVTYAIMGLIADNTDVVADAIRVTLDRPADAAAATTSFVDARSTRFGNDKVLPSAQMVSSRPATMRLPVSQAYSAAQMDEPVTAAWRDRLTIAPDAGVDQWQLVYRLQVLESYGMLQTGARALGFAAEDALFMRTLAASGVEAVLAPPGSEAVVATMDPLYPPAELANFDMVWANDPGAALGSAAEVTIFAERAMACLRPGGLIVFLFATTPDVAGGVPDGGSGVRLTRNDIERIALMLISRRHEVAQLKPVPISASESGGIFGIVARKLRTAL